jgi:hypothetical protein
MILFKPALPVLNYFVNYDYISTVLCENISTPELKCNGKCHLKKELAKVSDSEKTKSNEQNNSNTIVEILFCENISAFDFQMYFLEEKTALPFYNCIYFQDNSTSIFHPPILA